MDSLPECKDLEMEALEPHITQFREKAQMWSASLRRGATKKAQQMLFDLVAPSAARALADTAKPIQEKVRLFSLAKHCFAHMDAVNVQPSSSSVDDFLNHYSERDQISNLTVVLAQISSGGADLGQFASLGDMYKE